MTKLAYLRTIRGKTPVLYDNATTFRIGGCHILRRGDGDVCIILGMGITVSEALEAAGELEREGISVGVIDVYSLKPIDEPALRDAARPSLSS